MFPILKVDRLDWLSALAEAVQKDIATVTVGNGANASSYKTIHRYIKCLQSG